MRSYLRYKLNLRDLVEIMSECGLSLAHDDHTLGQAAHAFVKRWNILL